MTRGAGAGMSPRPKGRPRTVEYRAAELVVELDRLLWQARRGAGGVGGVLAITVRRGGLEAFGGRPGETAITVACQSGPVVVTEEV